MSSKSAVGYDRSMAGAGHRATLAAAVLAATTGSCAFNALDGFSGGGTDDAGAATDGSSPSTGDASTTPVGDGATPSDGGIGDLDAGVCVVTGMTTRICDGFERSNGIIEQSTPEKWSNSGFVTFVTDPPNAGQVASFA